MSNEKPYLTLVKTICLEWELDGLGEECFWEQWPECPTESSLTPRMVLEAIRELEQPNEQ